MVNESLSIHLHEDDGLRIWEMEGIPSPDSIHNGIAHYHGQKKVENLIKRINQKVFMDHEDRFLGPLCSIIESSLEQGVEDVGSVQMDNRSFYTRISWTGYSWKLPPELKRLIVEIDISKVGINDIAGKIKVPLKKIATDGGDILISNKIASKLDLKNGNIIKVRMRFCI